MTSVRSIMGAAVFALAAATAGPQARAADTIKILNLDVTSGPFKDEGAQYMRGVKYAVDQINKEGGINGQQIELITDDTQLKPDVAQRKATRYILDEDIKIIIGAVGTAVVKALAQVAAKHHVILAAYSGEHDSITGADFAPEVFRLILSASMHASATVAAFPDQKFDKVYLLNQDNAYGYAAAQAYKNALDAYHPGWKLAGEDYHPIATRDFAPYLQKIVGSGADVILTGDYGSDMTILHKQAANFGIKQPFGNLFLSNPVAMREIGDAGIGSFTSDIYMIGVDTPANKKFIEEWHAQYKDSSEPWPEFGIGKAYNAMMFLAEALRQAGSTDSKKVIQAFEGLEYTGVMGRQVMRACDHQVQSDVAAARIVKGPGKYYPFAFTGDVTLVPMDKISVPPEKTGNKRCMKQ